MRKILKKMARILLKKSDVLNKKPLPYDGYNQSGLMLGEVALNYNKDSIDIFTLDSKRISSSLNVVGDGNFYEGTSCWSSTLTLRIEWCDVCHLGTNGVHGVPRYDKWNVRRFGRVFVKN